MSLHKQTGTNTTAVHQIQISETSSGSLPELTHYLNFKNTSDTTTSCKLARWGTLLRFEGWQWYSKYTRVTRNSDDDAPLASIDVDSLHQETYLPVYSSMSLKNYVLQMTFICRSELCIKRAPIATDAKDQKIFQAPFRTSGWYIYRLLALLILYVPF